MLLLFVSLSMKYAALLNKRSHNDMFTCPDKESWKVEGKV